MKKFLLTKEEGFEALRSELKNKFAVLLQHGSMQIEYFKPEGTDTQTPHSQDEIYVIASGSSAFKRNNEIINCEEGNILFVPAGMPHHFENFSADFATWVIFYGPQGGE